LASLDTLVLGSAVLLVSGIGGDAEAARAARQLLGRNGETH
jgi:hypothetical protein